MIIFHNPEIRPFWYMSIPLPFHIQPWYNWRPSEILWVMCFSVPPSSPASYIALVLVTAHSLVDCTSTREGRPQNTSAAESHPRKDQSSGPKGPNHLQLALIPWYAPIWDNVKWVQMLTEEKGPKRLADPHLSPMKLSGKCQTIDFLRQRTAGMTFYGLNLT